MNVAATNSMVCLGFCNNHLLLHWGETIYSTEQSLGATLINCTVGKKWKYFIFLFLLSVFHLVLTFILFEMLSELSAKPEQSLREVGPG